MKRPPGSEFRRMIAVALLGAGIGYLTYEIIYYLMPIEPRATVSWLFAFIIGVIRQHYLHRSITFKSYRLENGSLRRAFIMCAGSALAGSSLNYTLVSILGLHHRLAWLLCLLVTASISLGLLRSFVFRVKA